MKTYHSGFAQFAAALAPTVTVDEPSLESDAFAFAEQMQAVEALNREIASECARAATLEAMIDTLAETEGTLTPFQVSMLQHAAVQVGVPMAHQRLGLGMEAYQSYRGRQLLTISTESLADTLKALVAKIVALFKRLMAWIQNLLSRRANDARRVISLLGAPAGKATLSPAQAQAVARGLSIGAEIKPALVIGNSVTVMESLTDAAYINKVTAYASTVKSVLERMVDKEGNWRNGAKEINTISFPVPAKGFERESIMGQKAVYRSLPMANGGCVEFDNTPAANGGGMDGGNDGVKGARARAEALAAAGAVRVLGPEPYSGNAVEDLKKLGKSNMDALRPKVFMLMKHVIDAERVAGTLFSQVPRQEDELKQFVNQAGELKQDVVSLSAHLITSIQKVSSCASNLLNKATDRALLAGFAMVKLHQADLG